MTKIITRWQVLITENILQINNRIKLSKNRSLRPIDIDFTTNIISMEGHLPLISIVPTMIDITPINRYEQTNRSVCGPLATISNGIIQLRAPKDTGCAQWALWRVGGSIDGPNAFSLPGSALLSVVGSLNLGLIAPSFAMIGQLELFQSCNNTNLVEIFVEWRHRW